jgi:redox-sensitive bicupin YhaK (pirin superfamily)
MTAGRGILHQEMPQGDPQGKMHGFQLWANLPSSLKMSAPRYQDIPAIEIPEVTDDDGTRVRVICGDFWGKRGPVDGVAADPRYLDVWVPPGRRKILPVETERHAFAYVFEGDGTFSQASQPLGVLTEKAGEDGEILVRERTGNCSLVLFDSGNEVTVQAGENGIRFLLVSGKPIEEPVAWHGPIVMNTQAELQQRRSPSYATERSSRAERDRRHLRRANSRLRFRPSMGSPADCSGALLLLDTLIKARDIDDHALVTAVPDRLLIVVRLDLEYERAAIDSDQFRRRADAHPDWSGGEVADIEMDAETLMTVREEVLDCRQRGSLDHIDHDWSGKHGHPPAADAGSCVFHADQQVCRSLHPGLQMRQVDHGAIARRDPSRGVLAGKVVLSQRQYGSSTDLLDGVSRAR